MKRGIITNAANWRSHKLQGKRKFQGLPISIENERGSYRQGVSPQGIPWRNFMHFAYGYVRATEGTDGDHVDVYLGNNKFSDKVFIVHQQVPETGAYDEDKVMLGFNNRDQAYVAYVNQYDTPKFYQGMTIVDMATFKEAQKSFYCETS